MRKYLSILIGAVIVINMVIPAFGERTQAEESDIAPEITVDVIEQGDSSINTDIQMDEEEIEITDDQVMSTESEEDQSAETEGQTETDRETETGKDDVIEEILPPEIPADGENSDMNMDNTENSESSGENAGDTLELSLGEPFSDEWSALSAMTERRSDAEYITAGGELYAIGGTGVSGYLYTIEKYNSESNIWQYITSLPGTPKGFAVAATNTDIYIIGGYEDGGYSNKVSVYNIESGEWNEINAMQEKRDRAAALCMDNKLYVFGGRNQNGFVDSYEFYDFTTNIWNKVTTGFADSMIRVGAKARYTEGFICVYGGIGKDYSYSGTDLYFAADLSVEQNILPGGYEHISIAWGENKALIFAGVTGTSNYEIKELAIENEIPVITDVNINNSPSVGKYSQYIIYNGYLYCLGGYNLLNSAYLNNVSRYSVYYGDYSSGDGTIESEVTSGGNQLTLNVEAGREYMLFINVKDAATFNGYTFTVEYPADSFEIIDGCAMTAEKDTSFGDVLGADISITELGSNGISFICTEALSGEVTKAVNAVILRANSSGQRTIKYSMTAE